MDLDAVDRRLAAAMVDRYHGWQPKTVLRRANAHVLIVDIMHSPAGGLDVQRVEIFDDGRILLRIDDGFDSTIVSEATYSDTERLLAESLKLLDRCVDVVQRKLDQARAVLRQPYPQPGVPTEDLVQACRLWQSGRADGSSLLRAAARVLVGTQHYFSTSFITEYERRARADPKVLRHAALLLQSVNGSEPRTADEWAEQVGLNPGGFAGRGLDLNSSADVQIRKALTRGRSITMPLWGVSLSRDVACSYGGDTAPRYMLQIEGEFRAVTAWTYSGIKPQEQELICGGRYRVLSAEEVGPTVNVRLEYCGRSGENVGTDEVLLDLMSKVSDVRRSELTRSGLPSAKWRSEKVILELPGNREFEVTREYSRPTLVKTMYEPGDAIMNERTWQFTRKTVDSGATEATLPAQADGIVRHLAQVSDPTWLRLRTRLIDHFWQTYSIRAEPWDTGGTFDLPEGYVQWTRYDEYGSPVHIEVGASGSGSKFGMIDQLVELGWNAPDETFPNCWHDAIRPERYFNGEERLWFFRAADLVILASTVVFEASLDELAVALGLEAR